MEYQISLFDTITKSAEDDSTKLKILSWNIQNPSLERAKKQTEWLIKMNSDILILTEVKDSNGFNIIRMQLEFYGYKLIYNKSNSYFTVIALRKINYKEREISLVLEQQRSVFIELCTFIGKIGLIGTYVPTNSRDPETLLIKKQFQDSLISEIKKFFSNKYQELSLIIAGDLNILDPSHYPRYPQFDRWNYFYNFFCT
jgi:exodeoxyribonuclease-3